MLRTIFVLLLLVLFMTSCVATNIQKCRTDHKYEDGKLVETYTECITQQVQGGALPVTLKHPELLEYAPNKKDGSLYPPVGSSGKD